MTRTSVSLFAIVVLAMLDASVLSAQSRDRIKPTAPANLIVTATTPHSVSLSWGPSTDNSGRFSYLICCAKTTVTVGQSVTSHTLEGLNAGATYTLRVYAKDAAGNISSPSNAVTVTLPGDPSAPTKPVVTVLDVGPTHATLNWSSTDNGPIVWYTISIDGTPVTTLNSKTATFTPLDQDTTYTFTVRARDVDGNLSPVSDPLFVTTAPAPNDHVPPAQPGNLAAAADGAFFNVSWTASTDDVAPQPLIRYDVYVNGERRAVVVGGTTAVVEGDFLSDNAITVIAVDTADNESSPATITVFAG